MNYKLNIYIICISFVIFNFLSLPVWGQLLVSPDTKAIQKAGSYPVNNFTGVPEIDIPLYTITDGDLQLPISISYHASGIKMQDRCSFVALGWTLNAGGMISIAEQGGEYSGSYRLHYEIPGEHEFDALEYGDYTILKKFSEGAGKHNIFQYTLPGMSGKFILGPRGSDMTQFTMPYRPIKIFSDEHNTNFNIYDEKGVNYKFNYSYEGAWALTDMESLVTPSNKISITYQNPPLEFEATQYSYYMFQDHFPSYSVPVYDCDLNVNPVPLIVPTVTENSYSYTITYDIEWPTQVECKEIGTQAFESPGPNNYFPNRYRYDLWNRSNHDAAEYLFLNNYNTKRVERTGCPNEITSKNGKVVFIQDKDGMLGEIQIFSNQNISKPIRTIKFFNSLFPGSYVSTAPRYSHKRFKLDAVKFYDENGQFVNEYKFEYYNADVNLPTWPTGGIDFWGYNNARDNTSLLQNWQGVNVTRWESLSDILGAKVGTADRSADFTATAMEMKTYTLKKISYPTGGSTTYDYETNKYYDKYERKKKPGGGLRVKSIIDEDENGNKVRERTFKYNEQGYSSLLSEINSFSSPDYEGCGVMEVIPRRELYQIQNLLLFSGWKGISIDNINQSIYDFQGVYPARMNTFLSDPYLNLCPNGSPVVYPYVTEYEGTEDNYLYKTEYEYTYTYCADDYNPDDNNAPSSAFKYRHYKTNDQYIANYIGNNWDINDKLYQSIIKNWDNGHLKSKYVYSKDGKLKGSVQNEYQEFIKDIAVGFNCERYIFMCVLPGCVGKANGEEELEPYFWHRNFPVFNGTEYKKISNFNFAHYHIYSGDMQLKSSTETVINGENSISVVTDYKYNAHNQVIESSAKQSDGKIIKTSQTYPLDYLPNGDFIEAMQNANMIANPIETVSYIQDANGTNPKILSATTNEYTNLRPDKTWKLELSEPMNILQFKFSNRNSGDIPPSGNMTTYGKSTLYPADPEVVIDSYDVYGNIIQVHNKNNIRISYYWSYNQTYPVIKAENISIDNLQTKIISAASSVGLNTTSWITDLPTEEQKWQSFNSLLRSSCGTEVMITTYTYDPLIGTTSQTDPNGITTFYEYDLFGRLLNIRDNNKKILKHYEYHYKQ